MATIDVTPAFKSLETRIAAIHTSIKSDVAFLKAHAVVAYLLAGGILGFMAGHFL